MKKINLLAIFSLIMALFILPSSFALLTAPTINSPPSTIETNDANVMFNATASWSGSGSNVTNLTFWVNSNQYPNGTRTNGTAGIGGTSGDFTFNVPVSALSEGTFTLKAEARNDSDTENVGTNSLNSSSQNFVVDRTVPTIKLSLSTIKINPFKQIDVECNTRSDSNTINTSSSNQYIIDVNNLRTTKTDSDGTSSFDNDQTSLKGEYKAGCNITDNAGNIGTATEEIFFVSSKTRTDKDAIDTPAKKATKNTNFLLIGGLMILIIVVIMIIVVAITFSKKKGKKKR